MTSILECWCIEKYYWKIQSVCRTAGIQTPATICSYTLDVCSHILEATDETLGEGSSSYKLVQHQSQRLSRSYFSGATQEHLLFQKKKNAGTPAKKKEEKSHLRNNAEVVDVAADDLERRPILHEGIILDPESSRRLATDLTPNHRRDQKHRL